MVEEAYELVDAIDSKDDGKIVEEAGDVLMPGGLSRATRRGQGRVRLRGRHEPRVRKTHFPPFAYFRGRQREERGRRALGVGSQQARRKGAKDDRATAWRTYPRGFPALLRAQKVGKRASKAGYDFKDIEEAAEKIGEELSELLQAVKEGDAAHISEETGDLLFSAVNVGRARGRGLRRKPAREHEKIRRAVFKDGEPHFAGRKRDAKPRARGTLGVLRAGKGTNRCRSVPLK